MGPMQIQISIQQQTLTLFSGGERLMETSISTARNGPGALNGSECTPLGRHIIRAKIGAGAPVNTVFVARRPSGELFSEDLRREFPARDWILTRILWLSGLEPGCNRLGEVDSMRRYIYIHGSPDSDEMGVPGSHGCIKMRNADVIELFERVPTGIVVTISESRLDEGL